MKIALFAALLLASVPSAFCQSQCGSATIADSDSQGAVRAKMECFAKENAALAAEHDKLKAENARLTAALQETVWAAASGHYFSWNKFPVDTCKSKATSIILGRKGTRESESSTTITFKLDGNSVLVECKAANVGGYVMAGSRNYGMALDLARELETAIFPAQ
jgi:hypothetical protein